MNGAKGKIVFVVAVTVAICAMMTPSVAGAYLVNLDRLMERGSGPLPAHLPASSNVKREGPNAHDLPVVGIEKQLDGIYIRKRNGGFELLLSEEQFESWLLTIAMKTDLQAIDTERCHPTQPFRCPGKGTVCISIQYLCDGAPDCPDGYDEHAALCTAAKRPPVEETASFMQSLLARHGPNYLEKLFGPKARGALAPLGGVQRVAVALSESETLDDFGKALHLMRGDLEHLRNVFMAVETGDTSLLRALGFRDSELMDMKSFLDRLASTGFME
ncbi:prohormone-4-like [Tropilaelaps mercedesae]|uniref:Prohormone-4-like n=1 Tax=Tropilaelaps mercedesae TaxID=418985 RepID=A0A1V9Y1K8_9ACAR|nr:prohormone-4-like [Tropilaelaps mercedesae]